MGKINVAAYGMALGVIGQSLLLAPRFGHVSLWAFLPLLGPWLLAHVISFCRVAPCGPRLFALLLSASMWWYLLDTLVCELLWMLAPTAASRVPLAVIAHAIAYGGASSFMVLVRTVREARTFAENHPESA